MLSQRQLFVMINDRDTERMILAFQEEGRGVGSAENGTVGGGGVE